MRTSLLLLCSVLVAGDVWAQGTTAYEADFGLIVVGGLVLFYDSEGPLSFQTMTPHELPNDVVLMGEVYGRSCQHGLSIPIIFSLADRFSVSGAKGDGSFEEALKNLYWRNPRVEGVYDVKVDVRHFSVLGIYKKNCTEVTAQGFKQSPGANPSPPVPE